VTTITLRAWHPEDVCKTANDECKHQFVIYSFASRRKLGIHKGGWINTGNDSKRLRKTHPKRSVNRLAAGTPRPNQPDRTHPFIGGMEVRAEQVHDLQTRFAVGAEKL